MEIIVIEYCKVSCFESGKTKKGLNAALKCSPLYQHLLNTNFIHFVGKHINLAYRKEKAFKPVID